MMDQSFDGRAGRLISVSSRHTSAGPALVGPVRLIDNVADFTASAHEAFHAVGFKWSVTVTPACSLDTIWRAAEQAHVTDAMPHVHQPGFMTGRHAESHTS